MSSAQPTLQLLHVDSLVLDTANPRIAKWLEVYDGNPPEEAMALALGAGGREQGEGGPSYIGLKQSIFTNGGVIHPIIVSALADGRYLVIEGNTRTVIYRSLRKTQPDGRWDRIPALVFEHLDPAQVDAIRLQAHLVGTRQWDPYSKGKYLDHLRNCEHLTFAQIVDFYGGDANEVSNYIDAYNDMEAYYRPLLESDSEFDPSRFSAFMELQGRVAEAVLMAGFSKKDFAMWVHTHLLHPLNTVRKLPRILQNAKARDVFLRKGAQEALRVLDSPPPATSLEAATLEQLVWELVRRVNTLSFFEVSRLRRDATSDEKDLLRDGRDAFDELYGYVTQET